MVSIIRRPGAAQTVPKGDNGWTEFPAPTVGTVYYVSKSAGNDGFTGLSEVQAWKTLTFAESQLVHLHDDHLLLKCGDDWTGESFPTWTKSGLDAGHPLLISTYGTSTARPIVGASAFGWNTGQAISNFAMVGIDLHPATIPTPADGWSAIRTLHDSVNLLFEDCIFRAYGVNIVLQTGWPQVPHRITNVRVRRCLILDAADTSDHCEGAYCRGVDGLLFEDCVVDHNGWSTVAPITPKSIFSQGLYVTNECTDVTIKGCWLSNSASDGHQLRCGGRLRNNIYMGNRLGCHVGGGGDNGYVLPGGVTFDLDNCLILNGKEIGPGAGGGWGFRCSNIASGTIDGLIIAGPNATSLPKALEFVGTRYTGNFLGEQFPSVGTTNVACNGVYVSGWGGDVQVGDPNIVNVSIADSAIPELHYTSEFVEQNTPVFLENCTGEGDVELDIDFYEDLLAIARVRPRGRWGPIYETTTIIATAQEALGIEQQAAAAATSAALLGTAEPHTLPTSNKVYFDVMFWHNAMPAGVAGQGMAGPMEKAWGIIPLAKKARIECITVQAIGSTSDATQVVGNLYVAGNDKTAAFGVVTCEVGGGTWRGAAFPLNGAPYYEIDSSLEPPDYLSYFEMRATADGTFGNGVFGVIFHVQGYIVR